MRARVRGGGRGKGLECRGEGAGEWGWEAGEGRQKGGGKRQSQHHIIKISQENSRRNFPNSSWTFRGPHFSNQGFYSN